jgi:hypothetical protein
MFAGFGSDMRLDVARPVKSHGVDGTFHAAIAGANDIHLYSGKLAMFGSGYRTKQGIGAHRKTPFQLNQ